MNIKRYSTAVLMLIGIVAWYVYAYVSQEKMSFELYDFTTPTWSLFVWVILPMITVYLFSVFHMMFHSLVASFKLRRFRKDSEKILVAIADAYLGKEDRNHSYKTPRYKLLGSIIDNSTLFPTENMPRDIKNDKLTKVLNIIEDIKNGKVVDLKPYALKATNALVVQNNRNKYKSGNLNAENILSKSENYSVAFCKEVYVEYIKIASFLAIEKHKKFMDKSSLFSVLDRINAEKNKLEITNESLVSLFESMDLTSKDYIEISTALSHKMDPEQRIKLFETYSEKNELAMEAYIYTLFDLEMISLAKDILDNSQENEYQKFKAYTDLKEVNKHYSINLFI